MKSRFIIYLPSDTREASAVALAKTAGIPLFLRALLELATHGEKTFTLVAPASHRKQILKLWQRVAKGRDAHLNIVLTKAGHKIAADELAEIKNYADESVYFINSNYVLPGFGKFAHENMRNNVKSGETLIFKPTTKRLAIVGFNVSALDRMIEKSKEQSSSIEDCIFELTSDLNHHYFSQGDDGIVVQKFTEIPIAEHILAEHIRKNTGSWVAREINKRISLPFSLVLARMRVTPNLITVVNIFIGLSASIGAAGMTYTSVLLGGILFQTASIIDGCDGEVAKLTFKSSKFGQYIDSLSDNLSLAAFLTGMMIHKWRISDDNSAFFWGGALITGAILIIAIMAEYLKKYTDSASLVTFDKQVLQKLDPATTPAIVMFLLKHFKMFFKKDMFSIMFLGFAILGILHWWFYIATIGVWVAVSILLFLRSRGYK